jgi:hypothetical protein
METFYIDKAQLNNFYHPKPLEIYVKGLPSSITTTRQLPIQQPHIVKK